jgi:hypothetical protein
MGQFLSSWGLFIGLSLQGLSLQGLSLQVFSLQGLSLRGQGVNGLLQPPTSQWATEVRFRVGEC